MQWIVNVTLVYVLAVMFLVVSGELEMDQATKDHILLVHNTMRKSEGASNMNKLVWNTTLEGQAVDWANRCEFKHKGMGENLAWNSMTDTPANKLIDKAMKAFYDEKYQYSYGQASCSPACHYTQLEWAETTQMGCATRLCQPLQRAYSKAWFLVCRYEPVGNWKNKKPYSKGAACSDCPEGTTCEDGLCVAAAGGNADAKKGGKQTPAGGNNAPPKGGDNAAKKACTDSTPQCVEWAQRGECNRNPSYMRVSCKKSCNTCNL